MKIIIMDNYEKKILSGEEVVQTYNIAIKGDIDCDGSIDLYDILTLIDLVFDTDSSYVWNECVRLAGNKADNWWLRQNPKVLNLPFKPGIRRADRDNTIDVYISDECDDVLRDGTWENFFETKPEVLTKEEKKEWLSKMNGVSLASDAFFPFGDNIERAHKSGVEFIVEPGGSIRDDNVIDTCNRYNMTLVFNGVRLFHH